MGTDEEISTVPPAARTSARNLSKNNKLAPTAAASTAPTARKAITASLQVGQKVFTTAKRIVQLGVRENTLTNHGMGQQTFEGTVIESKTSGIGRRTTKEVKVRWEMGTSGGTVDSNCWVNTCEVSTVPIQTTTSRSTTDGSASGGGAVHPNAADNDNNIQTTTSRSTTDGSASGSGVLHPNAADNDNNIQTTTSRSTTDGSASGSGVLHPNATDNNHNDGDPIIVNIGGADDDEEFEPEFITGETVQVTDNKAHDKGMQGKVCGETRDRVRVQLRVKKKGPGVIVVEYLKTQVMSILSMADQLARNNNNNNNTPPLKNKQQHQSSSSKQPGRRGDVTAARAALKVKHAARAAKLAITKMEAEKSHTTPLRADGAAAKRLRERSNTIFRKTHDLAESETRGDIRVSTAAIICKTNIATGKTTMEFSVNNTKKDGSPGAELKAMTKLAYRARQDEKTAAGEKGGILFEPHVRLKRAKHNHIEPMDVEDQHQIDDGFDNDDDDTVRNVSMITPSNNAGAGAGAGAGASDPGKGQLWSAAQFAGMQQHLSNIAGGSNAMSVQFNTSGI
jgi:hypothetical protein